MLDKPTVYEHVSRGANSRPLFIAVSKIENDLVTYRFLILDKDQWVCGMGAYDMTCSVDDWLKYYERTENCAVMEFALL